MANYHSSLRTIPVFTFYEVLYDRNYDLLLFEGKKTKDDLKKVWRKIEDEYFSKNGTDNRNLKRIAEVEELKKKYRNIDLLLQLVSDNYTPSKDAEKEALASYGYVFSPDKTFQEEIDRMRRNLSVLKTKISIEEGKLPKGEKSKKPDLIEEALALENTFPNTRDIDIYTMPMEKWMGLKKLAFKKIKAQK